MKKYFNATHSNILQGFPKHWSIPLHHYVREIAKHVAILLRRLCAVFMRARVTSEEYTALTDVIVSRDVLHSRMCVHNYGYLRT